MILFSLSIVFAVLLFFMAILYSIAYYSRDPTSGISFVEY